MQAIVGTVGAGKSSVVSALLGEMEKLSGRVNTVGSIAYVSQQAWIQNASLQDNILFGTPMDRRRYNQVIEACALKPDLEMLPGMNGVVALPQVHFLYKPNNDVNMFASFLGGDATEIGEKGINLSGGQKQRKFNCISLHSNCNLYPIYEFPFAFDDLTGVSLARAVYADADVYFFDDPLSAVDSHVGKHIFENVIGPTGMLASKTRILVTHGVTYLPNVDEIYVVKDGEISEKGNLKELIEKKGDFADFLIEHLQEANEETENLDDLKQQLESTIGADKEMLGKLERAISRERSRSDSQSETASLNGYISADSTQSTEDAVRKRSVKKRNSDSDLKAEKDEPSGKKLIEQEKAEVGSVKWDVYKHYLKSIGVGLTLLTIVLNIIYQGFSVGSNAWLTKWSTDKEAAIDPDLRNMYLGVYAAFGLGQGKTFHFIRHLISVVRTNFLVNCFLTYFPHTFDRNQCFYNNFNKPFSGRMFYIFFYISSIPNQTD